MIRRFFGADPTKQIVRDPGGEALPIQYTVTENTLQLTFDFDGAGYPARVSEVGGEWVFTFGL